MMAQLNKINVIIFLGGKSMAMVLFGVHMGNRSRDSAVGGTVRWCVGSDQEQTKFDW